MSKGYKQLAGYSITPAPDTLQQTPTQVICTKAGEYAFSYPDHTDGQTTSSFITGSNVTVNHGNITLDINPVKWTKVGGGGAAGDVIFVYRRIN